MPLRHQLSDADTLEGLSVRYFGNENHVDEIITYNNLVTPYISTEPEDRYLIYARGYVYVERENATTEVLVRKNWTLKTRPSIMNATTKSYVVTEDVLIPAGTKGAYLPVRAVVGGLQGNTLPSTIQVLGDDFTRNSVFFTVIKNEEPIRGGIEGRILTTGDYLFIPSEEGDLSVETTDVGYNQAKYFYAEDLKLVNDDLAISSTGDLATVGFVENVKQAVEQRLKAEKGDNPSDYNWGTNIPSIIGDGSIPREALPKRVEIEILQALGLENRVHSPEVTDIDIQPSYGAVYIDVSMKVVSLEELIEIQGLKIGGNS